MTSWDRPGPASDHPSIPSVNTVDRPLVVHPFRTHRPRKRGACWLVVLGLFLMVLNLGSPFLSTASAAPLPATILLKGSPSKPNTISPTAGSTSVTHPYRSAAQGSA